MQQLQYHAGANVVRGHVGTNGSERFIWSQSNSCNKRKPSLPQVKLEQSQKTGFNVV